MILDAKSGLAGVLARADTGERIPHAFWANIPDDPTQPGEFRAWVCGLDGRPLRPKRAYHGRCPLRFIASLAPAIKPASPSPPAGEPVPVPSLPRPRRVTLGDPFHPCEHPTCNRYAEWVVSHEQELPAVVSAEDGRRYEAARTVRVRWWCSWHYQRPTLRHIDGELEPVEVSCGRPQ